VKRRRQPGSHLSLLFEFFATTQRIRTLLGRAMADSPLTPDEYAIYSVIFDEGPSTPTDLAHRVGMPPTTMSHYVRAMVERGHVIRSRDPLDGRASRLALAEAGLDAHAEAGRAFAEANERFMAELAIGEAAARRVLASIRDAADQARRDVIDASIAASA
jgi:DNA-binding MarR family transcriptional regulator